MNLGEERAVVLHALVRRRFGYDEMGRHSFDKATQVRQEG
jgi:hypothetical protein